ncbi:MAG: hypothetical protein V9H25_21340 [Candidatus Competibacter sp.]
MAETGRHETACRLASFATEQGKRVGDPVMRQQKPGLIVATAPIMGDLHVYFFPVAQATRIIDEHAPSAIRERAFRVTPESAHRHFQKAGL